jgi:hypothetical protein
MTNRTSLLLVGAGLSLITLGSLPRTLQAQQPAPPLPHIEMPKFPNIPPTYIPPTYTPPTYPRPQPPAWLQFLKDYDYLVPSLIAAAVLLPIAIIIWVPIVVCRIVLGLIHVLCSSRDRASGGGPRAPSPGNGGT